MWINFQRKTQRKKPCQIDLLIETKYTLYVCEIKFRKKITRVIISEVRKKIERLKSHRALTVRPVLIYTGGLASGIEEDGFFDKIIHFEKLLSSIHV